MNKTIVMEGDAALTALEMVAEARDKFPILRQVTDEEALILLIYHALTGEAAKFDPLFCLLFFDFCFRRINVVSSL